MKNVREMNSYDVKSILKSMTGLNFENVNNGPQDASFTIQAQGLEDIENHSIEYITKFLSGLLIITEPVTRLSYYQIPPDIGLGAIDKKEAEQQMLDEFAYSLDEIDNAAYQVSQKYGVVIKMERNESPRLYSILHNHKTEDDLINLVNTINHLLSMVSTLAVC